MGMAMASVSRSAGVTPKSSDSSNRVSVHRTLPRENGEDEEWQESLQRVGSRRLPSELSKCAQYVAAAACQRRRVQTKGRAPCGRPARCCVRAV